MAKQTLNYNILIVGVVVVGGLYFWQKIKATPNPKTAQDYISAVSGSEISAATQPTIRTDLRQSARVDLVQIRQSARTTRAENRQQTREDIWRMLTGK